MAKAKSVSYKRTTTTALKAAGYIEIDENGKVVLDTDDGRKNLSTLLSDFQGANVDLSVTVKSIDDLVDPSER